MVDIDKMTHFSKNSGKDGLGVQELNIALENPDQFQVDGLRFFEVPSYATTQKGFMHIQTNVLQIVNVEEVLNVVGRLICYMHSGCVDLWDGWMNRGLTITRHG